MRFAAEGWRVTLLAREAARLAAAVEDVEKAGGKGRSVPTDVAEPAAVESAAEEAESDQGPID
ncbi:MAG TPA: SDR family NAD(P)-dependent oxidoreductase, partial [Woeseiaceae bacterium]|nr:SDR family NAD(P)-dependent oxidoreductase [Woeseiaceae bacterium]